jgi:hypothetical protein
VINKKILIILTLLLTSCATTPKVVYLPTVTKAKPLYVPLHYHDPVKNLTVDDKKNYPKVAKAYAMSRKMCINENIALRKQLKVVN